MPGGVAYALSGGRVVVKARSTIHDTTAVFSKVSGRIDWDAAQPDAARAELSVDMKAFDAGDRLKNWKLKSDMDPDRYPTAAFKLTRLEGVREEAGRTTATAVGTLSWRGRDVEVRASGSATVSPSGIEAKASFELNVRSVGMEPPKILMFKVDEVVLVEVTLSARP